MVMISVDLRSAFVNANTILTNLKKQEMGGEAYGYKVLLYKRQYYELYEELRKDGSFLYFLNEDMAAEEKEVDSSALILGNVGQIEYLLKEIKDIIKESD